MTAIPDRTLPGLLPPVASSPGIRVRIVADAFIPWSWVEFPDPPPPPTPILGPAVLLGELVLHFFVHGDGRLLVSRSDDIGSDFRIQGVAEVDVIQLPGETVGTLARNQMSKSELRALGRVVHTETNRGPLSSTITADRLTPNSVAVKMVVSGSVPWNVAGPQPAIDFEYNVTLTYDPPTSRVKWTAAASHDGFPGHEMFIECNGVVRFNKNYLPTFFSPVSTGTAKPSIAQAVDGARALGGATHAQTWSLMADFAP